VFTSGRDIYIKPALTSSGFGGQVRGMTDSSDKFSPHTLIVLHRFKVFKQMEFAVSRYSPSLELKGRARREDRSSTPFEVSSRLKRTEVSFLDTNDDRQ
jgi:hypothetical protein